LKFEDFVEKNTIKSAVWIYFLMPHLACN